METAGGNLPLLNEGGRLLLSLPQVLLDGPITMNQGSLTLIRTLNLMHFHHCILLA